ncbi:MULTISPECIES: hypothetical protein [Streptomyces]|uniref:Uncharacterized protein n=1 Tax=Streptomyces stelliscabiei TaxID=146820 RepID=A0A8I0PF08_9ACTN|nr:MULTISPECIES: hypothetical protein [Streptomyces]MBE1600408.1 hypothetical protein [Streptomyces stelliscabiei]MDX2522199.1 hypothetical protein [Streptomyces stelliscabiei]SOD69908.1 hypothetical protein SAMN06272781_2458 [Streptomyces sp. 1222.2]
MGARSFMLATRIPMARDGFEEWLRTPLPGLGIIENPSAMYTGWAADGAETDWDLTEVAVHYPAAPAAIRADREKTPSQLLAPRAAQGLTLLRHRDDALEAYLYDYHGEETGTHTALLMLAGAGRFAPAGTESPVLYWGGDVDPGLPMNGDRPLAVLLVGSTRSRFVATYPLEALIAHLTPVETDFLAATAAHGADDEHPGHVTDLLDPVLRANQRAAPPNDPLSTR